MDDRELDTLVRGTAPSDAARQDPTVREAELALLAEITSLRQHRGRTAAVAVLATAATVAAVVAVGGLAAPGPDRQPPRELPVVSRTSPPHPYSLAALSQAKAGPKLVLDAAGWTVQDVEKNSVDFHTGAADDADGNRHGQHLEVTWYPASSYEGYRDDRAHVSAVEEIPVLGVIGRMVTYERGDYAVMLPPSRGIFVEIRSSGLADEAAYLALLGQLRQVSARAWLDSLPTTVVVPRAGDDSVVAAMLDGVPLPPGFDVAKAAPKAAADYYQTGAHVSGSVACGWLASWTTARAAGDAVTADRAVAALATSRQWAVLRKMNPEGDYPEVVWEYADLIAQGSPPRGYVNALGCNDR